MTSELGFRPIRTERAYADALARISALMGKELDEAEDKEFDELVPLIEAYEKLHFPVGRPDPIDVIKFHMEQAGLPLSDLAPIFGTQAKASEALGGKSDLTMKSIRALHAQLGIPAKILTRHGNDLPEIPPGIDFDRFPVVEMARRGWVGKMTNLKDHAEEIMRELVGSAGGWEALPNALFRRGSEKCAKSNADLHALRAWCLHVLCQARRAGLEGIYRAGNVNPAFLRELARLSPLEEGPKLAKLKLAERGIAMVVAEHFPGTYLDGAAFWTIENVPVVGMTIRHDSLDNFWFCLLHELAHIACHFQDGEGEAFIDDLRFQERYRQRDDEREREADEWARESLIPYDLWIDHPARVDPNAENVASLAQLADVHPAIVAGRIRHERDDFRILTRYAVSGKVRPLLMGTRA